MPVSLLLAPAGSLITAPAGGCSMCAGNVGVRGAVRMVATAEPTMSASWTKMDKMKSRYGGLIFQPDENLVGDDIGFSYDEMSAQMQEIISYTRGDTCTGTILGFEPNGALVDIGVKSSAYCALGEMALVKPSKCEDVFAIGDSVEFVITSREDENGQLMLSRRRILYQEAWDHVAQLYADDATCEAEVSAVNRGGAMVQVEGLRAFLPGSHFLAGQTPTEALVGSKLAVKARRRARAIFRRRPRLARTSPRAPPDPRGALSLFDKCSSNFFAAGQGTSKVNDGGPSLRLRRRSRTPA